MTAFADTMWIEASRDVEAESAERRLAVARVRAASVWPFLAGARSRAEYVQREQLVLDRIASAVDSVSPANPVLLRQVRASFADDWDLLPAAEELVPEPAPAPVIAPAPAVGIPATAALALRWRMAQVARLRVSAARHRATSPTPATEPSAEQPEDPGQELREANAALQRLHGGAIVTGWSAGATRQLLDAMAAYDDVNDWYPTDDSGGDRLAAQGYDHGQQDAQAGQPAGQYQSQDPTYQAEHDRGYQEASQARQASSPPAAKHATLAACGKCTAGKTPDGKGCQYCDGVGALTHAAALVKEADGWGQGLVRNAVYHPDEFGAARYEDVPSPPKEEWAEDEWDPTGEPWTPGPPPVKNTADGTELKQHAAGHQTTANPYDLANNPYRVAPADTDVPEDKPVDEEAPTPPKGTPDRNRAPRAQAAREARVTLGGQLGPAGRMAAEALATNPQLSPAQAWALAREALRRYPQVTGRG